MLEHHFILYYVFDFICVQILFGKCFRKENEKKPHPPLFQPKPNSPPKLSNRAKAQAARALLFPLCGR